MTKPKLTDKELWDALDEATSEAEIERIVALTPEQVREELVALGEDPAVIAAEADAFFATLDQRIAAAKDAAEPADAPLPADAPVPAAAPVPADAPVPAAPCAPEAAPARARVAPLWRRPAVVVTAGVAGVALAAGVLFYIQSQPDLVGSAPPEPPRAERALHMRQAANAACEQHDWKSCLDDLDEARTLDPDGDSAVEVQALWKKAREGAGSPPAPSGP
jgi:hypothetical protein